MEIINLKKTKLLTKEQQKPHENAKICYISRERFEDKLLKTKIIHIVRLEIIVIMQGNIEVLHIAYVI